jgi:desulfoferrodoxin-like iron-binding protein
LPGFIRNEKRGYPFIQAFTIGKFFSAFICGNLRPNKKEGIKMANQVGQVYVCEICGTKVKMLVAGKGVLICCGQPMKLTDEK